MTDHSIKLHRAQGLSIIGDNPSTYAAISAHLPERIITRCTAAEIAATIDALYRCSQESKALARREDAADRP